MEGADSSASEIHFVTRLHSAGWKEKERKRNLCSIIINTGAEKVERRFKG